MSFWSELVSAITGGGTNFGRTTGPAIQRFSDSMKFKEPTRLDRFLAGPNQTVDMSEKGRKKRFEDNVALNQAEMTKVADMVDPMGERTDPNTGRSVRETRGYEQKSGSTAAPKTMMSGSSTPAAATKTEPTPPAAPKTVGEDATSSGEIEDEVDANKGKGKKSTILTSAQGLLSEAPTRGKRKLKGLIA
tara:strand:+ start:4040 stop:4609 length:570 start_codon:yes stop_codon:yes gene_type:complete